MIDIRYETIGSCSSCGTTRAKRYLVIRAQYNSKEPMNVCLCPRCDRHFWRCIRRLNLPDRFSEGV